MVDLAGHLPEDLLYDVLGRLPLRSLAVCRSVCKAWHAAIDARRLLCTDHLPLSLQGIFLQLVDPDRPYRALAPALFSRHSMACNIADLRRHPLWYKSDLLDCCNGLLLLSHHVVNPATQQWAPLPPEPHSCASAFFYACFGARYLVFDPYASPHYEVVLVPGIPRGELPTYVPRNPCTGKRVYAMEWPPTPYIMYIFSSKTGEWKERSFVREGEVARMVVDWQSKEQNKNNYAAYCRGALYVPCKDDFILRINLSSDKYQVVQFPEGKRLQSHAPRLGKSEKGVYCVFRYAHDAFQVWFLDESRGRMEWLLKNDINFDLVHESPCTIVGGAWILQGNDNNDEELVEHNSEWDPSHANVVSVEAWVGMPGPCATFEFLGFHPYRQIALFAANGSVMAYHLSTSKVRDLGYIPMGDKEIQVSFPYMPCWMGPLPGSNSLEPTYFQS